MRSIVSSFAVALALFGDASVGAAQQTPMLEPGMRVRIGAPMLPADERVGRVIAAGGDTVAFQPERSSNIRSVRLSDIGSVEVSTGRHRRVARGAGVGTLVGGSVGAILGYATWEECEGFCIFDESRGSATLLGGLAGGILGLAGGTLFGFLHQTEGWRRVWPEARVGIKPTRAGAALSITSAF